MKHSNVITNLEIILLLRHSQKTDEVIYAND